MTGYIGPLEKRTLKNKKFRQVLFTGKYLQLVVMSLLPGEEIGSEVHPEVDQFFRIEDAKAKFVFNETEEYKVSAGDAVLVPAGTLHNVINPSKKKALKLYTLYSPPNHADGTIQKTKAEADASEKQEHQIEPAKEKVKAGRKTRTPKLTEAVLSSEPAQEPKPE
jgi:mannose-6-phosphate isomerase-like protein (cupin superfamily)